MTRPCAPATLSDTSEWRFASADNSRRMAASWGSGACGSGFRKAGSFGGSARRACADRDCELPDAEAAPRDFGGLAFLRCATPPLSPPAPPRLPPALAALLAPAAISPAAQVFAFAAPEDTAEEAPDTGTGRAVVIVPPPVVVLLLRLINPRAAVVKRRSKSSRSRRAIS